MYDFLLVLIFRFFFINQMHNYLSKLEQICLHTPLSIAIVSLQLNVFYYFYLPPIILFNINNPFTNSKVVTSIAI